MPEKKDDAKFAQLSTSYWENIRPAVYTLTIMAGLLSALQSCDDRDKDSVNANKQQHQKTK